MNVGRLFIDSTPNVVNSRPIGIKSNSIREEPKPKLQFRESEELYEEEEQEDQQVSAYATLIDEGEGVERDDYEETNSSAKWDELIDTYKEAKEAGNADTLLQLEALIREYVQEEDEDVQEQLDIENEDMEGMEDMLEKVKEKKGAEDEPPLEPKHPHNLYSDIMKAIEEDKPQEYLEPLVYNLINQGKSQFVKELERMVDPNPRIEYDSVEMHEYAKLVNASYQFFEHKDYGKVREYMSSNENRYIAGFNEWRVEERFSSADNLVFAKYGRDLNNPTITIACRGTAQAKDWLTNLQMVMGSTADTKRFQELEQTYLRIASQFPNSSIRVTGHSQGGGMSYALAQKYNLKGYHYDPAVFPQWELDSSIDPLAKRQEQQVFRTFGDVVSFHMNYTHKATNVKYHTVMEKNTSDTRLDSPHSLSNYYLDGYDGDVSRGVPVKRGGNVGKLSRPVLKRLAGTELVKATGKWGSGAAFALTLNETYHAAKRIETDTSLKQNEKEAKKWLSTMEKGSLGNVTASSAVYVGVESAAAGMLATAGATGAIAVGLPLLMAAGAAVMASEVIHTLSKKSSKHADVLGKMFFSSAMDVSEEQPKRKKRRSE